MCIHSCWFKSYNLEDLCSIIYFRVRTHLGNLKLKIAFPPVATEQNDKITSMFNNSIFLLFGRDKVLRPGPKPRRPSFCVDYILFSLWVWCLYNSRGVVLAYGPLTTNRAPRSSHIDTTLPLLYHYSTTTIPLLYHYSNTTLPLL